MCVYVCVYVLYILLRINYDRHRNFHFGLAVLSTHNFLIYLIFLCYCSIPVLLLYKYYYSSQKEISSRLINMYSIKVHETSFFLSFFFLSSFLSSSVVYPPQMQDLYPRDLQPIFSWVRCLEVEHRLWTDHTTAAQPAGI